jgi:hypothetical protein
MKGFFTVLLMVASIGVTGTVYAQQSQSDFSPRQSAQQDSFAPQRRSATNTAPQTNQTRLAALQGDARVDSDSENYVIMDDDIDFPQQSGGQRSFIGPENNPNIRNTNRRDTSSRNTSSRNTVTRNPAIDQPRYSAQSSERSATSVLPSRNGRSENINFRNASSVGNQPLNTRRVSSQSRTVSSIYDLHVTPALEDELKNYGYLYAKLDTEQARSDQVRLFGDSQRARSGDRESKIFSSQISDYDGNLVIDIDDEALRRIEEGSYTLDDFNRYDARGVVLRYVSRNNEKVDLARLDLGQRNSQTNSTGAYRRRDAEVDRRDVVSNRRSERSLSRSNSEYLTRNRNRDSDGDWVLPANDRSRRDSVRELGSDRTVSGRDSLVNRYDTSSIRRNYQDRMADIYRDDTVRTRPRLVDRRYDYDDVTYNDRRVDSAPRRDVIAEDQRALDKGFAELTQWQRDLARQTREIEERRRELDREGLYATTNGINRARYETAGNQTRQVRSVELDRLRDLRSPVVTDRYADSRNSNPNAYTSPYLGSLGSYATLPTLADSSDPRFAPYAKNNLDQVARLNQKFAAMQQANELAALENKVDNEYQKQQLAQAQAKLKNGGPTVKTFIDDGEVRNTLGGNMAAGRGGYAGDRYVANVGDSLQRNGGVADMSLRSNRTSFYNGHAQSGTSTGASDKLVRALWFIALLSIGMNMYLALLARSFYSRYNELADELRETFTSSSVEYSTPSRSVRSRREHDTANPIPHRAT